MTILTMRTDKPEAELGLYEDTKQISYSRWQAHRELAETLPACIAKLLEQTKKEFSDIEGIVVYVGPGSFTGLRIGLSVANALAYSLTIPITGNTGDNWIEEGHAHLIKEHSTSAVMPVYGAPVHITRQRN